MVQICYRLVYQTRTVPKTCGCASLDIVVRTEDLALSEVPRNRAVVGKLTRPRVCQYHVLYIHMPVPAWSRWHMYVVLVAQADAVLPICFGISLASVRITVHTLFLAEIRLGSMFPAMVRQRPTWVSEKRPNVECVRDRLSLIDRSIFSDACTNALNGFHRLKWRADQSGRIPSVNLL